MIRRDDEDIAERDRAEHAAEIRRNSGRLVTQRQLLREVWGPTYETETNYLRVYLAQLRRKAEVERPPSHRRRRITRTSHITRNQRQAVRVLGPRRAGGASHHRRSACCDRAGPAARARRWRRVIPRPVRPKEGTEPGAAG